MSDIEKRLRYPGTVVSDLAAADEIKRLRFALRRIILNTSHDATRTVARAALEPLPAPEK